MVAIRFANTERSLTQKNAPALQANAAKKNTIRALLGSCYIKISKHAP